VCECAVLRALAVSPSEDGDLYIRPPPPPIPPPANHQSKPHQESTNKHTAGTTEVGALAILLLMALYHGVVGGQILPFAFSALLDFVAAAAATAAASGMAHGAYIHTCAVRSTAFDCSGRGLPFFAILLVAFIALFLSFSFDLGFLCLRL
jgi:hypothetical protein